MHPDLEDFLETAFERIQPTSTAIGRVVIEPDYDAEPAPQEASVLTQQLTDQLRQATSSASGFEVPLDSKYTILKKYVRRITLHSDSLEGPWVEVAPPGNWI
jgi:hypothetical protein